MNAVALSDVRDAINVGGVDVPDDKLKKMVDRAAVMLSLVLKKDVDPANCSVVEKEFITLLSAVYAICYLTGGSAVGLNFSVGDQNITLAERAPPLVVFQQELQRMLDCLKKPVVRSV